MKLEEVFSFVRENSDSTATPANTMLFSMLFAEEAGNDLDNVDEDAAETILKRVKLRYDQVVEQHAAVAEELQNFDHTSLTKFGPEQIWMLVRTIKVQAHLIQLLLPSAPEAP